MPIHRTAIIDPRAEIHPDADIGPYVVIDGAVRIGARTRVAAHATLSGWTTVGADNVIHAHAAIGDAPQDSAYDDAESYVRIGDRNVIREHTQIHRGTKPGSATTIGDDNFLMTMTHVGHNCALGNHIIMATGATLGGYVTVEDQVFISGNCVVHQFVRIGRLALLRGLSRTSRDVPPFCIMDGTHTVRAVDRIGMRRVGFTAAEIREVHRAFARLFGRVRNLSKALEVIAAGECSAEVRYLLDFIRASTRGVCRGVRGGESDDES